MKTINKCYSVLFVFLLVLTSCKTYKQDLSDSKPPKCEVGILVGQKTLPKSTEEWGKTKNYVQLDYTKQNKKGRSYEFYVSASDKGGLEKIEIEVCPKDALVPGSLKELTKTFTPSDIGSYFVSGKIRALKKGEKVSIIAKVTGKSGRLSETHITSIYAYADDLVYQNGGRPHKDLCQSQNNTTNKYVIITLNKENQPRNNEAHYCACINTVTGANTCPNDTQTRKCEKNSPIAGLTNGTKAKYIENHSFNGEIIVKAPDGMRYPIPKGAKIAYAGSVYGNWSVFYKHIGGLSQKGYIKVHY